jgi:hypothetical protein
MLPKNVPFARFPAPQEPPLYLVQIQLVQLLPVQMPPKTKFPIMVRLFQNFGFARSSGNSNNAGSGIPRGSGFADHAPPPDGRLLFLSY